MTTLQRSVRLEASLSELADIETAILMAVRQLGDRVAPHPDACTLFTDIEQLANDHLIALRKRHLAITGNMIHVRLSDQGSARNNERGMANLHPASSSLRALYSLLHEAVIAYSTLTLLGARFRDSWAAASEGTSAHIGRAFSQEYMAIVGRITEIIHDVVRWELDSDGLECRCTCPSCGIGICVGPAAMRAILKEAWDAARPPVGETGITVHPPRKGSAALDAGFRQGDVIVSVDGITVDSLPVMSKAIKDHEPMDQIKFGVRRNADVISLVVERRSDLGIEPGENVEECVEPAGDAFHLDRARDIQARVHENDSTNGTGAGGLSSLSPREIQVLRLAAVGASNPVIAEELGIRRATVARHIANILEKLGAANRTEAVSIAATGGLLSYA